MTNEGNKVYTVSEITSEIKELLEYNLENVCITGEISNFRVPASGHFYFTLKDEKAQIKAVMFRQNNIYMRFTPTDGMQIVGRGRISVYEPQGTYQIILDYIEPAGIGALKQAYEELKAKLGQEGLFDAAAKKKLPLLLNSVGVVTSPTGAAIRDFLSVATRRYSNIRVIIYPVRVQGEGAAREIAEGIRYFNTEKNVDAIVLTRGGGSFEDLFCFSEEIVVRAVHGSGIPVISAVGHETDYSLSDFAADLRAPTPSAAAELIVANKEELEYRIDSQVDKLKYLIKNNLLELSGKVEYHIRALGEPVRRIDDQRLRIDDLTSHLVTIIRSAIKEKRSTVKLYTEILKKTSPGVLMSYKIRNIDILRDGLIDLILAGLKYEKHALNSYIERLELANPFKQLKKGYSIAKIKENDRIVKTFRQVNEGTLLNVRLGEGSIDCKVTKIFENS